MLFSIKSLWYFWLSNHWNTKERIPCEWNFTQDASYPMKCTFSRLSQCSIPQARSLPWAVGVSECLRACCSARQCFAPLADVPPWYLNPDVLILQLPIREIIMQVPRESSQGEYDGSGCSFPLPQPQDVSLSFYRQKVMEQVQLCGDDRTLSAPLQWSSWADCCLPVTECKIMSHN